MRVIALTGLAGVGKTAMLGQLAAAGEQVLDLEALAAHRGSAFGRIGIAAPQPSQLEFDMLTRNALASFDHGRPVWLEDEGPHIGSLWLSREVNQAIAAAETVQVTATIDDRVHRLTDTYGRADRAELIEATQRMRRRLGNSRADRAISHFHAGRPEAAIRVLLLYFDDGYARRGAPDTRRRLRRDDMGPQLPAGIRHPAGTPRRSSCGQPFHLEEE